MYYRSERKSHSSPESLPTLPKESIKNAPANVNVKSAPIKENTKTAPVTENVKSVPQPDPPPRGGPPSGPPPAVAPQMEVAPQAVEPGGFRFCLYKFTYVWPRRGNPFWFYPTFLGRRSVAGFRWTGSRWVYYGMDLREIRSFRC